MKAGQDQSQHQHNQHNQQTKQDFNSSEQNHKYIIAFYCIQLPQHFVPQIATWDASASSGVPLPGAVATQDPLNPLTVRSAGTIRGVTPSRKSWQSIYINRRNVRQKYWKIMYQQTMHKSESASCNIRETHAASKAARMRFSFLPRVTEKLAKVCKLQGQAEHGKETQNHKLDTRSLDVGITRASKRSTLTCCETTTTESSKLLKAFWLHKNKAISFGCLGTNASSGHSLQMTNEHAGKLLAKPTASYVCSKSLKPLQAIQ